MESLLLFSISLRSDTALLGHWNTPGKEHYDIAGEGRCYTAVLARCCIAVEERSDIPPLEPVWGHCYTPGEEPK